MISTRTQSGVAAIIALTLAAASLPAFGQSASDKATAVSLFDEGKKLVKAGKYAEACGKFELSQKLDPGVGTLGSLADCYEKAGKTASAWQAWRETAAAAASKGQADREKYARDKAKALEPKVAHVTITVPAASHVPGLEVHLDGSPGAILWEVAIPMDPGTHTIEARAPGRKTYATSIAVSPDGGATTVTIPPLDAESGTAPPIATTTPTTDTSPLTSPTTVATTDTGAPPTATDAPTSTWSSQKTAALAVGGVGVVGIVVGSIFGLRAKSKNDDANSNCRPDDPTRCTSTGVSLSDDAHSAATISTIAFIAGGAALVGGAVLWLTAPKEPSSTNVGVGFGVANGGLGLTAQGAF